MRLISSSASLNLLYYIQKEGEYRMKRIFELIELILRAYRLSDHDIEVMAEKGYYFDLSVRRWIKS